MLYTRSKDKLVPLVDHPHHILDPNFHYKKGCRYFNKQLGIDSFLDWEGHHWVCITVCSLSPYLSIRLANCDNAYILHLPIKILTAESQRNMTKPHNIFILFFRMGKMLAKESVERRIASDSGLVTHLQKAAMLYIKYKV